MAIENILLIDNYDSFTRNLEHLLAHCLRVAPSVVSYARMSQLDLNSADLIVISPGPGRPSEYPEYRRLLSCDTPIIGICLGMQVLNELYGGATDRLKLCVHGKTGRIEFDGRHLDVARYHSLYANRVADCFDIIARSDDGVPMAIRHASKRQIGYQFHPESFMTEEGGVFIDYALYSFANHPVR